MIFRSGGKFHVTGGVQGSFHGILHHANDKADTDHLHGDIIGDAKQGAGHGDQQQGAASHAGSAAGTQSTHHRKKDGGGQGHLNAQRIGRSQRHNGNGDGGTIHIDGSAQGDGDGIHILIQPQLFAQIHIDRDVGGRAAGEEGGQAGFTQAAEHQRIRVAVQIHKDDKGRDDQCHKEHGAHQQEQQPAVLGKDGQAVAGHVGVHKAHDAEGCQIDDPADDLGDCIRCVRQEQLGAVRAVLLHGQTEQAGPEQDADVIAVQQGTDGVCHKVGEQGVHHLAQTLGHHLGFCRLSQNDGLREQEAGHHRNGGGQEGGEHIQPDDRAKAPVQPGRALRQRTGHDNEHQHRSNALQGTHEQAAELFHPARTGHRQCQHRTDHKADDDAQDQAGGVVPCRNHFQRFHNFSTPLSRLCAYCAQFSHSSTRNKYDYTPRRPKSQRFCPLFLFFISTYTDTSFFHCPYMKYRFTKRDRTPCVSGCGLFLF